MWERPRRWSSCDALLLPGRPLLATAISIWAPLCLWAQPAPAPRFGVFEASVEHAGSPADPYAGVTAAATFRAPDGSTREIPLFWDGGTSWKARLSPDATGRWSWSIRSGDAGLDGRSGTFDCVDSSLHGGIRARPAFPHHLEHEDGTPFWWFGDTMWNAGQVDAAERLDRDSFLRYVDLRAGQGFNYIHAHLGKIDARNEGGALWEGAPGGRIRPAYFQEIDRRIRMMNAKGITVGYMLAWAQDWQKIGEAERLRYARYVTGRYAAMNVVFIVSGEYDEALAPDAYRAIGREIARTDPHGRMIAIHGTGSAREFAKDPWMSFGDYQQLYEDLHREALSARVHRKPVVNSEYAYYLRDMNGDGKVDKPNSGSLDAIRHASWDIAMAGAYLVTGWGTTYYGGYRDPGPFDPDAAKNKAWEAQARHLRTLFRGLEWWSLEPNDGLLEGGGTRYCLAEPGRQYVAYVRGAAGAFRLSLGEGASAGAFIVKRFDPRKGAFAALPDHEGVGPVLLEVPDRQDWVFVVGRR